MIAEPDKISVRPGRISKHIDVVDFILRHIDAEPLEGSDEEYSGYVVQGHAMNKTDGQLDDVGFDVSYFDSNEKFLGLDKSTFLDTDEIEPNEHIAFSIDLNIPDATSYCVLNVSAKKMATGFFMRWFYKG